MHIPKNWRINAERYQMQASLDEHGKVAFPPRPTVAQRDVERYNFAKDEEDMREAIAS